MTSPVNFYADFKGLAALKNSAGKEDPQALREVARQFESVFTQMMLKSMRTASLGESLMDNEQSKFYLEMFDNQMAMHLSKGRGLGLADLLVKQLQGLSVNAGINSGVKPGAKSGEAVESVKPAIPAKSELRMPSAANAQPPLVKAAPEAVVPTTPAVAPSSAPAHTSSATPPIAAGEDATRSTKKVLPVQPLAKSPDEFVAQMWPHAQSAARELGVDPRTLIAHAALETGWGKFVPCNPDGSCSFNLFGIKATPAWQGERVGVNTVEYEDGVATRRRESFRAYDSPADSFRDYAALLKNNGRYAGALGADGDAKKFASALQQGGYATDPNYAQKLAATASSVVTRAASLLKSALLKTEGLQPLSRIGTVASNVATNVANTVAERIGGGR